jgi:hypothetical protein
VAAHTAAVAHTVAAAVVVGVAHTAGAVEGPRPDMPEEEAAAAEFATRAALAEAEPAALEFARPGAVAEAEAVAAELAARDWAASRGRTRAWGAPELQQMPLALLFRCSPGSRFGKAELPARIGDISS